MNPFLKIKLVLSLICFFNYCFPWLPFMFWLQFFVLTEGFNLYVLKFSVSLLQLPNFVSCLEGLYYSNTLIFYAIAFMILYFITFDSSEIHFSTRNRGKDLRSSPQMLRQFIEHNSLNDLFLSIYLNPALIIY